MQILNRWTIFFFRFKRSSKGYIVYIMQVDIPGLEWTAMAIDGVYLVAWLI